VTNQVIYDRGYRTYDGPRTGPGGARRAVFKEGIRRVLGLGRKARQKIFPWSLITIALISAAVFIGIHWAIGNIQESLREGIPTYGGLFDFYSAISLLFIALAGPQLLIPDRESGALSVYFSRPLTVDGYLGAKLGAFCTVVGAIYIVPQVVLHIGLALIADEGFLPYMGDNLDILWKVPVTTLAFIGLHGAIVFILSSVISRTGIAAAAFLGLIVAGSGVAAAVAAAGFAGSGWFALLSIDQHPRIIRDYFFGDTVQYPAEAAGFDVWVSVLIIVALVAIAIGFVRYRYRKLA
jgi:ABC-2 type transport system permease protein